MTKKNLREFAASDGTNTTADPVETGSTQRPADKTDGETAIPQFASQAEALKAMMSLMSGFPTGTIGDIYKGLTDAIQPGQGHAGRAADQNAGETGLIVTSPTAVSGVTKEDVETIFKGENLSEELIDRATIVLEAAVSARLVAEIAALNEAYDEKLAEEISSAVSEIQERVDAYLTYAAEEFVKENKLAIVSGMRAEMLENMLNQMKEVWVENYVDVPEDKVDVMEELVARIDALEADNSKLISENSELRESNSKSTLGEVVAAMTEGMAMTDASKLRTLIEGVDFSDAEELKKKAGILKETYFPATKKASGSKQAGVLNEEVDVVEDKTKNLDPRQKAYYDSISKLVKN